jgi:hypothetical protein
LEIKNFILQPFSDFEYGYGNDRNKKHYGQMDPEGAGVLAERDVSAHG